MLGNRKSQHSFAQIPDAKIARSQFNRSFSVKDTIEFDYLYPVFVDEVLPGDTKNVTVNSFARLATPLVPIMDNLMVDYFFFFVPNRLIWDNWERFNGAQDDPGDTTDYVLPQMNFIANAIQVGSFYEKMGLPTQTANAWTLKNCLPFRAYNKIWNDWFRDQNLQNSATVPTNDGPDSVSTYGMLPRNKQHDYFTSALPWPQKGPAVELPLGTTAPVNYTAGTQTAKLRVASTRNLYTTANDIASTAAGLLVNTTGATGLIIDPNGTLETDLSSATAATINQLREAFAMQSLFELDARGGTRYVEILRAHFNVVSPDFRLQRAEYLGGGTTKINLHPVAQTAPTEAGTTPQGNLAAFGTTSTIGKNIGFTKSFVEHGYVIGLACARADITYQQGLNKMWDRSTRYDFYWPKLSGLGEQAILNKEIYLQGTSDDANVFGYQERYAEYRYKPSEIRGAFRSTYAQTLDYWHMAEEFASLPSLNDTFIRQNTPIERAIATPSEPHLLVDLWFDYKDARPMPVYSTPASLGRF